MVIATDVGQHERRSARVDDVHRLRARHPARCELGVPVRAAIDDPRGAVGIPLVDAHRLSAIERRLRRRRPARAAPLVRDDHGDDSESAANEQLRRHRGAHPRGDSADDERDAYCKQVERAGQELEPHQQRCRHPPHPVIGHS